MDLNILADAYYCTKNGKIKGIMTLTEHLILFNPIKCSENEPFVNYYNILHILIGKKFIKLLGYHWPIGYCFSLENSISKWDINLYNRLGCEKEL